MQSLFGLMDTQPIQAPIKSGEVTLPFYEGHYYVAYTNSSFTNKEVTILKRKEDLYLYCLSKDVTCEYYSSWPYHLFHYHNHHYTITCGTYLTTKPVQDKVTLYTMEVLYLHMLNINRVLSTNQRRSTTRS